MFSKKPEEKDLVNRMFSNKDLSVVQGSVARNSETSNIETNQSEGNDQMSPSILGDDLSITGNISSKGEIQIDGEVQGDIYCSSMIVGENAHVSGGIAAEDVVVRGKVTGSIRGIRVTLQANSQVEGDIYHQSLAIEQGAYFEGKSRRSDDPLADLNQMNASFDSNSHIEPVVSNSSQTLNNSNSPN